MGDAGGEKSHSLDSFTEDEILVAQILIDLPDIIRDSNSRSIFKWGGRRRRSRLDGGARPSRAQPSPSFQRIEARKSKSKAAAVEEVEEEDGATTSPVTPLSFAPSESDEKKSRHGFRKNCTQRSKEEYLDLIEELTQRRDLLRGEIENVTKYYNRLKSYNSELKIMKKEISNSCLRKKELEMGKPLEMNNFLHHRPEMGKTLEMNNFYHHQNSVAPYHQLLVPRGPVTAQFYRSRDGLGTVSDVGPLGIPDLNICAGEDFGFDPSGPLTDIAAQANTRARFAEARRLRKGIIKIKSMRRACGIRLPVTRWPHS
ncbi:zinc finger FYVE domain-containing protein 26 [Striga asiatica]|uniref:Zinc finger FYVE domain-containing protein 26 n=1 Tax=Striga asiatica TaxID=4170 RepID=A0A5A7P1W9_STRAF|nr:zinc finger FYVE domain-containing protein 26 [Striga asiatica]